MENILWGIGIIVVVWFLNAVFDNTFTSILRAISLLVGIIIILDGISGIFKEDKIPQINTTKYNIVEPSGGGENNDGASSNSGYSEDGRNDIYNSTMQYNEPSYNSNNNNYSEPVRNPCRACRGTGDCPVCKGSCQTQTKVVYHYDGGMDLEWEQCKSCGGDGRHQGCGGDGWLDEGVDF